MANVPEELRPLVRELERSWGVVNERIKAGLDWASQNGYLTTALVIVATYEINSCIERFLRDPTTREKYVERWPGIDEGKTL